MAAAKGGRKRARPKAADAPTRLVDAALKLAALQGWDDTGMGEIAAEAGLPLAEARAHFASKEALLEAFVARIDQAMLAGVSEDLGGEPVRDRLFDVIMRRFDAMAPYKDGIAAILRDYTRDPVRIFCFASGPMRRSLDWILTAADAPSWGPLQSLQREGLGLVVANALRIWLRDDSPDLAKTMAAVDSGLARAESMLRLLPRSRRPASDDGLSEAER